MRKIRWWTAALLVSLLVLTGAAAAAETTGRGVNGGGTVSAEPAGVAATTITVTSQPEDEACEAGDRARFAVTARGEELTYQWQYRSGAGKTWRNTTASGNKTAKMSVTAKESLDGYQYRCKIGNVYGTTTYSKAATLAVLSGPQILTQPEDEIVGVGEKAVFSLEATGSGLTYQWQYRSSASGSWKSTTFSGNKTDTLTVTAKDYHDGYQYRCRIKDDNSETVYSDAVTLTVCPEPEIVGQPADQTVEAGKVVYFGVEATGKDLTYQWQYRTSSTGSWKSTTFTGAKTDTLRVTVKDYHDGYQYRCRVRDLLNVTVYSQPATLTVRPELKITGQPEDCEVYENSKAIFSVEAEGEGLTYQWQYKTPAGTDWKSTTFSGAKTDTLTVTAKVYHDGYQYRCCVTDVFGGTVYSDAAALTVRPELKILSHPADQAVEENEAVEFAVEATGKDVQYVWQYSADGGFEWVDMAAGNEPLLTVSAEAKRDGWMYRCAVTDAYGMTVFSDAATLTVYYPPEIVTEPEDQIAVVEQTAVFTVEATGKNLVYEWQYREFTADEWTPVEGADSETLTVETAKDLDGFQYRCVISDGVHEDLCTDIAVLTVFGKAEIVTHPVDQILTKGSIAEFAVEASGYELTYQWQYRISDDSSWRNATGIGNKTAHMIVSATESRDGYQYRCRVTDAAGNVAYSDEVLLMIGEPETVYIAEFFASSDSSDAPAYAYACFMDGTEAEIEVARLNGSAVDASDVKDGELCGYACGGFNYIVRDGKYCLIYIENQTVSTDINDFGQPIDIWKIGKKEIGTYVKAADAHYEANVASKTIYEDVELDEAYEFTTIIDGVEADKFAIQKKDSTKLSSVGMVGNGSDVYVYVDEETIVVINTYLYEAADDYNEKKETLTIEMVETVLYPDDAEASYTLSSEDWDGLGEYADGDYVLVTIAEGELKSIAKAEPIKAVVDEYVHGESVTAGGEVYKYSAASEHNEDNGDLFAYALKREYSFYMDEEGYVLFGKAKAVAKEYVYIAEFYRGSTSTYAPAKAYVYFTDGTEAEIDVSRINGEVVTAADVDGDMIFGCGAGWYTYTVGEDGAYRLISVEQAYGAADPGTDIVNYERYHTRITTGWESYYGNSGTQFLIIDEDGDVRTYTGIKNAPEIVSGQSTVAAIVSNGIYAKYVFIDLQDGEMRNSSVNADTYRGDLIFMLKLKRTGNDTDDNEYYEYAALVNGEERAVRVDRYVGGAEHLSGMLWCDVEYNEAGYLLEATAVDRIVAEDREKFTKDVIAEDVVQLSGNTLAFGPAGAFTDYFMADEHTIFVIECDGSYDTYTMKQLTRAEDLAGDTVYGLLNADAEYYALYIVRD